MKKHLGLYRLVSLLLVLMLTISIGTTAFAAEMPSGDMVLPDTPDEFVDQVQMYDIMPLAYDYSEIPEEMMDNSILRALAYTGYDVQYQKDTQTLYHLSYMGSALKNNDPDVFSDISYSFDGSGSGLQTIKDGSTVSGRAPDLATFRSTGLDCADFCAYYLCNYLPNIEGVDVSMFTEMRQKYNYRQDDMRFWQAACEDLAAQGRCDAYLLTTDDSRNNTEAYQNAIANCRPGDLIRMGTESRDWVHYAIYAGTFNGEHYLIHVANARGPEISLIRYQDNPSSSKWSVPLAFYHFYWNDTDEFGNIKVNKKDGNGNALAGAEFTAVHSETGDRYLIGPTDQNGYAELEQVPYGTYSITETKFPAGYGPSDISSWTVTIDKDTPDATVSVDAVNWLLTGKAQIVKTATNGGSVAGWHFAVKDASGNTVGSYVTDASGVIVLDLVPGTYTVTETDGSYKYWVNDPNPTKILTVKAGETATVTFTNQWIGKVQIIKKATNGGSVAGWHFEVRDSSGNVVGSYTTDASGIIALDLQPGNYTVVETDGEYPYWHNDPTPTKTVTVKAGETSSVTFENRWVGKAKVIKVLSNPEAGTVAGWTFTIHRLNGTETQYVTTVTTGEDGSITYDLEPGQYLITEELDEGSMWECTSGISQTITVTAGQTAEVSFTNALRPGKIQIQKVDTQGQPLAGVEFLLEWSEDGVNWQPVTFTDATAPQFGGCTTEGVTDGKLKSDANGAVVFDGLHPLLQYRLTETATLDGYQLLAGPAYEGELPLEKDFTVTLTVVNAEVFTLPKTGSKTPVLMPIALVLCLATCASALLWLRKKEGR